MAYQIPMILSVIHLLQDFTNGIFRTAVQHCQFDKISSHIARRAVSLRGTARRAM